MGLPLFPEHTELVRVSDDDLKEGELRGVELGYRYGDSPLVMGECTGEPDLAVYEPTTEPGDRLPHVWLDDGSALHDRLGDGFTVLRLGDVDTDPLVRALRTRGAPVAVMRVDDPSVRKVYDAEALLVRPDLHVAWRADREPHDPELAADTVTGTPEPKE